MFISQLVASVIGRNTQGSPSRILTTSSPTVHTKGGVVTPAQQLLVIVPKDTEIEVEAMVLNRDIGFVKPGQHVEIKIDSFPFTRYGTIQGTVRVVPKDAVADEKMGLIYPTRIAMKSTSINAAEGPIALGPGMTVMAEIKTGDRRLIQYIISPINEYLDESMRER